MQPEFFFIANSRGKKTFILQSPKNQIETLPDIDSSENSSPFKKGDIVANKINIASSGLFHHLSGRLNGLDWRERFGLEGMGMLALYVLMDFF